MLAVELSVPVASLLHMKKIVECSNVFRELFDLVQLLEDQMVVDTMDNAAGKERVHLCRSGTSLE